MKDKKADIFQSGKELFLTKGFKDTNISDIAKNAGIGVGTFYNYYSSKEKLFVEIYTKENEQLKKAIMESLDLNQDPVSIVKKIVERNIDAIHANPILKEWYNPDFFRKLEKIYHKESGESNDSLPNIYKELFKKWKMEGRIREDIDDELLLAFFDSLVYIDTHKEEIGIQHFPQIILYLAEFIIKGVTDFQK
ncbi:TetR/AcrR family transcriptional regulator [Shimazuella sp. AN120528]|uniref:TetR/AcrR family transcriptional regulator n=1 Tax=Shimazuella soli TaxID=1892854 RepID=UPI001F0D9E9D|nr:TetR/AcrR family transcriptional regulator [Shimazuella soli]MCH5585816.1 TetR/AcrR family transcriptional regulator [Shimazuella soli]